MAEAKPFRISKWAVHEAWTRVRANKGAAGVDGVSVTDFERKLQNNLYRIWNRMSSGSYMPPPVRRVMIPKADGGRRPLGIPTVGDRVAQMVVKMELEPKVEPVFHPDSYGYRPGKSALDAVGVCRQRCWRCDWVVDLDIKGFFDNIDHTLMMRAVRKHTDCPWVLLYIERWLKAPVELEDGTLLARERGTPQGGVISPLLANIFLHHVLDEWMREQHPGCPFERYADDVVIHCPTHQQARQVKAAVERRLEQCELQSHPDKTRIVYCRDGKRRQAHEHIRFDFLGYGFAPRKSVARGTPFTSFLPAVSRKAAKAIAADVRGWKLHRRSDLELDDLSRLFNAKIRGWVAYFGRFGRATLRQALRPLNRRLALWAQKKYKRLRRRPGPSLSWLQRVARSCPTLFAHWQAGFAP